MRKPANVFLLAILLGALGAAMVYRFFRAQQAELEAARRNTQGQGAVADVVVASQAIPIGTRIEATQLKIVHWPADAQPEGAVHDPQNAVGHIARATIPVNQPLAETQLATDASGVLPMLITEGMRAMSVKVDKVTGVSGFITPNSSVDVLVTGSVEDGDGQAPRSKLVLQNIKVLAIGMTIEQHDDKPVEVPTVTLLVSPEDAERLTLAARQDPLRLALRNYRDADDVTTPGTTMRELFGLVDHHDGVKPRVKTAPPPPPRPSVEVLLGETRTRQPY